jgi:DNA-binding LytR/AlgR family response regulator
MDNTKDKTIAIIDDCENDLQRLTEIIQAAGIDSQISCFSSAEKFINNNQSYAMAVLDIDLGDTNGIRLSKEISQRVSYIVYATALREKMREAFGYKVVGFINKCDTNETIIDCFKTIFEEYFMRLIHLDTANGQIDIQQQEIIYITLQGRFPTCCLNENRKIQLRKTTLKQIQEQLDPSVFIKINREELVNINMISSIEQDHINLVHGEILYMSRRSKKSIERAWLKKFL